MNSLENTIDTHDTRLKYRAVVIGVSAGGLHALNLLLPSLPATFSLPILIVQHRSPGNDQVLEQILGNTAKIHIKEAEDKEKIRSGYAYIAPPDYHLLVERDNSLSLSSDEKVHFSRPSIDVLFESAAYVWSERLIAVVLTGANADGAHGADLIKKRGGTLIVQDPSSAAYPTMPEAALSQTSADYVLNLKDIAAQLCQLSLKPDFSQVLPSNGIIR